MWELKWHRKIISLQNIARKGRKRCKTASNDRTNQLLCIGDRIKLSGCVENEIT